MKTQIMEKFQIKHSTIYETATASKDESKQWQWGKIKR